MEENTDNMVIKILCRKVKRLEDTVDKLIDILENVGLVETDKVEIEEVEVAEEKVDD